MATKKSVKKSATKEAKKTTAKKPSVAAKKPVERSAVLPAKVATKKSVKKATKKAAKKAVTNTVKKAVKKAIKATEKETAITSVKKVAATKKANVVKAFQPAAEAQYRKPSADPVIRKLVEDLVAFLDEKKLTDIKVMNLEDVNPYFCFFMIATAGSSLQLGTTAREISRRFGEHLTNKKIRPIDVESGWVIHDFVDVVLHVFVQEQRNYYNLEKLWGDAPVIYSAEAPRFQWPR